MDPIDRLTELFEKFPGIGPRQARRFVQYVLTSPGTVRTELGELIKRIGTQTAQCKKCYRWFVQGSAKTSLCDICGTTHRDTSTLFVVEKDADIDNVERSGYKGLYFVLGGTIPLAAEEPGKHIRLAPLEQRIQVDAAGGSLKEVILGLSATSEGDHTGQIISETLRAAAEAGGFKLSSLGRGLSTGSELEYADPDTISSALNSRQ